MTMAEITLADPATLSDRLSDLAERIWQVKGVIGSVRDAVSEEDACSDTANALSLAHELLDAIAGEVVEAHKPTLEQLQSPQVQP
jgi:DNA-binding FrmR family transcriptional regulator